MDGRKAVAIILGICAVLAILVVIAVKNAPFS